MRARHGPPVLPMRMRIHMRMNMHMCMDMYIHMYMHMSMYMLRGVACCRACITPR